jgi:hypothetical protein
MQHPLLQFFRHFFVRTNRDYYDAMNQDQTYMFLDKLKELFG